MNQGTTAYMMADTITQLTGEVAGVITIPRDSKEAADLMRGQLEANRPLIVITRDTWEELIEPTYGLFRRFAYEVRGVSPGGLVRLHFPFNRVQAHPKPVPIRAFLGLFRPEATTTHPPKAHLRPGRHPGPGQAAQRPNGPRPNEDHED